MSYGGERLPLNDWRIEASLLAGMAMHPRICDAGVDRLTADDFFRPGHQAIFRALAAIRGEGKEPDPIVLTDRLASMGELRSVGGAEYIDVIVTGAGNVNSFGSWIEVVREKANLRSLQSAIDEAEEALHGGASYTDVASRLTSLDAAGSMAGIVEAGDVIRGGPLPRDVGYPTGIPLIDLETSTAGAATGQMCVVLASEGVGKSTLMLQIATNAAWSGRGVLYVSLADLNQQRLVARVLKMRCGFSNRDAAERHAQANAYLSAEEELRNRVSFGIDDRTKRGSTDVDDIIGTIDARRHQAMRRGKPLHEVFIDYAQKFTSRHFRPSDSYAMSVYCSKRLSRYAENSGLTIWVGSQKTDGSEKMGSRDKTKGGNHWNEDAGLGVTIWSPNQGNDMMFRLDKSRFGGQWRKAAMVFSEEYLLFLPPGVHRPW